MVRIFHSSSRDGNKFFDAWKIKTDFMLSRNALANRTNFKGSAHVTCTTRDCSAEDAAVIFLEL